MIRGAILLVLGMLIIGGCATLRIVHNRRKLRWKVDDAVDRHLDKLVGLRAELLSYGSNGELRSREWDGEIERFMHSQLAQGLTAAEATALERCRDEMARHVAARAARAAASPFGIRADSRLRCGPPLRRSDPEL